MLLNWPLLSLVSLSIHLEQSVATPIKQRQGSNGSVSVQPFKVNISAGVPAMLDLIRNTELPEEPQYPGVAATKGIDLDVVKSLRDAWLNEFSWEKEEAYLNG